MDLLLVTPEEKRKIHEYYNVDEKQIKEDVMMIKSWKEKQPHLPDILTDDLIEKMLLRNKFRVERTKHKLDNYYSLRGLYKDLIQNLESVYFANVLWVAFSISSGSLSLVKYAVFKVKKNQTRFFFIIKSDQINFFATLDKLVDKFTLPPAALPIGDASLTHVIKLAAHSTTSPTPTAMRSFIMTPFYLFFHLSTYLPLSPLTKIMYRKELYFYITIHENLESLYKVVLKEYLTSEYSGTLGTIPDLL
ncbi:unnamed protein product [Tenebrio molitor]|nr:unnamed protein product [Tenebrio molitor]